MTFWKSKHFLVNFDITFFGTHPTLTHVPPIAPFSTSATFFSLQRLVILVIKPWHHKKLLFEQRLNHHFPHQSRNNQNQKCEFCPYWSCNFVGKKKDYPNSFQQQTNVLLVRKCLFRTNTWKQDIILRNCRHIIFCILTQKPQVHMADFHSSTDRRGVNFTRKAVKLRSCLLLKKMSTVWHFEQS